MRERVCAHDSTCEREHEVKGKDGRGDVKREQMPDQAKRGGILIILPGVYNNNINTRPNARPG